MVFSFFNSDRGCTNAHCSLNLLMELSHLNLSSGLICFLDHLFTGRISVLYILFMRIETDMRGLGALELGVESINDAMFDFPKFQCVKKQKNTPSTEAVNE